MTQRDIGPVVALSTPDVVVQDYLDFMLRSVTEVAVEMSTVTPAVAPVVAASIAVPVAPSAVPLIESHVAPAGVGLARDDASTEPSRAGLSLAADVTADPSVGATALASATVIAPQPRAANGRPLWAQQPFECLLFQVLGLKLAAPLIALGGIARIAEDLTPIFGQSDWFMGLLRWNDRNIKVVDTARLIMPERLPLNSNGQKTPYEFVLLIEGTDWGLAMDSATEALHMTPDEVRWRTSAQTRPWLAGTVLQKMCALLDMNAIAQLLQSEHTLADTDAM